jgi:hypothetical protein
MSGIARGIKIRTFFGFLCSKVWGRMTMLLSSIFLLFFYEKQKQNLYFIIQFILDYVNDFFKEKYFN